MAKIEAIPAALNLLLRLKGMSQRELAARSGMREEQVSRYLTGKVANPGMRQLFRLLDALEVDLGTFHFVHRAVVDVQDVIRPRRAEELGRLNRRMWDSLLHAMSLLEGPEPESGEDRGGGDDPVEQVLRLLTRLEDAGENVARARRGLMRLLAMVGGKRSDPEEG